MDIYCLNCGEPWDVCSIAEVRTGEDRDPGWKLDKSGYPVTCPCCPKGDDGQTKSIKNRGKRARACALVRELLGGDLDGAAGLLEDGEYLGVFEDE